MWLISLWLIFNVSIAFDMEDLQDLRELVIDEIKAQETGLTYSHPLVGIFDGTKAGDDSGSFEPLIAGLIRLAFHDCSGSNPKKGHNPFNAYICDGCIKFDEPDHKGLYEGAIEPLEPICEIFYEKGLSRADCWALSATFAVEIGANNSLNTVLRGPFGLDPTTLDILPGDIPYLIGRKDCDTSPYASDDAQFIPFKATDGWDTISKDMKKRFGLSTNQQVVSLIGGGHSVGGGHAKISGFVGGWDLTREAVDNAFFQLLINKEPLSPIVGLNVDFYQAREIDVDLPDLVELNDGIITNRQFLIDIPEHVQPIIFLTSPPRPRSLKYLNCDVSMAFDLRKYINNGLENDIQCHTDAFSVCGDKIVQIDGYETIQDNINGEAICEIKQCPLQCPDGAGGFSRFNAILEKGDLYNINPNSDCIYAFVEQFAADNTLFSQIFMEAFKRMIITGYRKGNSEENVLDVVSSGVYSDVMHQRFDIFGGTSVENTRVIIIIVSLIVTAAVIAIVFWCYKKKITKKSKLKNVEMQDLQKPQQTQSKPNANTSLLQ
eukprot:377646_1